MNNAKIPVMICSNRMEIAQRYILDPLNKTYNNDLGSFRLYQKQSVDRSQYIFLDPLFFPKETLSALHPVYCLVVLCVSEQDSADQIQHSILKLLIQQINFLPCDVQLLLVSYNNTDGQISKPNKHAKRLYQQFQSKQYQKLQIQLIDTDFRKLIPEQFFLDFHKKLKNTVVQKIFQFEQNMKQTRIDNCCLLLSNQLNYIIISAYIFKIDTIVEQIKQLLMIFLNYTNQSTNKYKQYQADTLAQKKVVYPLFMDFYHLLGIFQAYNPGGKSQFGPKQPVNKDVIQQKYKFITVIEDFYDQIDNNILINMSQHKNQRDGNVMQFDEYHMANELFYGKMMFQQLDNYQIAAYLINLLIVSRQLSNNDLQSIFNAFIESPFSDNAEQRVLMELMWSDLILGYTADPTTIYTFNKVKFNAMLQIFDTYSPREYNYQRIYQQFKTRCKEYLLEKYKSSQELVTIQLQLFNQVFLVEQSYQNEVYSAENDANGDNISLFFSYGSLLKIMINDSYRDAFRTLDDDIVHFIEQYNDIQYWASIMDIVYGVKNVFLVEELVGRLVDMGNRTIHVLYQWCAENVHCNAANSLQARCLRVLLNKQLMMMDKIPNLQTAEQRQSLYNIQFAICGKLIGIVAAETSEQEIGHNDFVQLNFSQLEISQPTLSQSEIFNMNNNIIQFNASGLQQNIQFTLNASAELFFTHFKYVKLSFSHMNNEHDVIIIKKLKEAVNSIKYDIKEVNQSLKKDQYYYLSKIGISTDQVNWFILYNMNVSRTKMQLITQYIQRQSQSVDNSVNELLNCEKGLQKTRSTENLGSRQNTIIINMIPYQHNINIKLINQQLYYDCEQNIILQVRIPHPSQLSINIQLSNIDCIGDLYFVERTQQQQPLTISRRQTEVSEGAGNGASTAQNRIWHVPYAEDVQVEYQAQKLFYIIIPSYIKSYEIYKKYRVLVLFDNKIHAVKHELTLKPIHLYHVTFSVLAKDYVLQMQNISTQNIHGSYLLVKATGAQKQQYLPPAQDAIIYQRVCIDDDMKFKIVVDLNQSDLQNSSVFGGSLVPGPSGSLKQSTGHSALIKTIGEIICSESEASSPGEDMGNSKYVEQFTEVSVRQNLSQYINVDGIAEQNIVSFIVRQSGIVIQRFNIVRRVRCTVTLATKIVRMRINQRYELRFVVHNQESRAVYVILKNAANFVVLGPSRLLVPNGITTIAVAAQPVKSGVTRLLTFEPEEQCLEYQGILPSATADVFVTW